MHVHPSPRGHPGFRPSLGIRNSGRAVGSGRQRAEVARRLQRAEVRGRSRRGGAERGRDGGGADCTVSFRSHDARHDGPPQDPWPSGSEGEIRRVRRWRGHYLCLLAEGDYTWKRAAAVFVAALKSTYILSHRLFFLDIYPPLLSEETQNHVRWEGSILLTYGGVGMMYACTCVCVCVCVCVFVCAFISIASMLSGVAPRAVAGVQMFCVATTRLRCGLSPSAPCFCARLLAPRVHGRSSGRRP